MSREGKLAKAGDFNTALDDIARAVEETPEEEYCELLSADPLLVSRRLLAPLGLTPEELE